MVTRLWRGWTATQRADSYERFLLEPQALALLSRYDDRALHFDTASFLV